MIKRESGCVSCGFPCRGRGCPHYEIERCFCDVCKDEVEELYEVDGIEICEDCLKKRGRKNEHRAD